LIVKNTIQNTVSRCWLSIAEDLAKKQKQQYKTKHQQNDAPHRSFLSRFTIMKEENSSWITSLLLLQQFEFFKNESKATTTTRSYVVVSWWWCSNPKIDWSILNMIYELLGATHSSSLLRNQHGLYH
jgi:hypothetical protein